MRGINSEPRKERIRALVLLGGIALGGAAGMDMVITGKLDPMTPGMMFEAPEPRDWYDRADAVPFYEPYRPYTPTSFTPTSDSFDSLPLDETGLLEYADAELAGAPGARRARYDDYGPSEAELRAEIEQLYQASLRAEENRTYAAARYDERALDTYVTPDLTAEDCLALQSTLEETGAAGCANAEPAPILEDDCSGETTCAAAPLDQHAHAATEAAFASRIDRGGDRRVWNS